MIKIFGGNFFEIVCNNQTYKKICEYADTHLWLDLTIAITSSFYCQSMYNLAILQQYKFKRMQFSITFISIVVSCILKIINQYIGLIGDIWNFILLPMIFIGKKPKEYLNILYALLLTWAFQILSLLVKNLGLVNVSESYFIGLIYSIDVYIMCALYYLYRNYQKEYKTMGKLWGWFMGKPVEKLKEMKAKREAKRAKLDEEILAIETEIARQTKENKEK